MGRSVVGALTVAGVVLVAAVVAGATPTTTVAPVTEPAAVDVYVILPPDCADGPADVTVENRRPGPVEVLMDGVPLGTVEAGASARFAVEAYTGVEITEAAEPVPFEEAVVCAAETPDPAGPAERPDAEPEAATGPVAGAPRFTG